MFTEDFGMGSTKSIFTINVQYRKVEDHHVFTSSDLYGLYVASKDPKKAYEMLGPSVTALVQYNHGKTVSVEPAFSFAEFAEQNGLEQSSFEPWLAAIEHHSQQFVVRAA